MDTFTFHPERSWVVRAFGSSSLVRPSDRAEALLLVWAFVMALAVMPFAGMIASNVHVTRAQMYAEQSRIRQPIAAEVTANPAYSLQPDHVIITAPVSWQLDGVDHVGRLEVTAATEVGDRVQVWVDDTGTQVGHPPAKWRAGADALVVAVGFWVGTTACVAGLTAWLRAALARRRDAALDREWALLINDGGGRTGSQT